jgi:large subunit ribosomal protein L25
MKTVSVSGSPREGVGKKDAKRQRAEGRVPCVLYGGSEQVHFTVDEKEISKLLFTPETFFIEMDVEGKKFNCILRDVQYHPVSDRILHIDFLEFDKDKPIVTSVPIQLEGNAPGIIAGGVMVKKFRKLPVKALPEKMPEYITIDISELEIGDKIHVGALHSEDYEIMEKDERFVCGVLTTRLAAVTPVGEEEGEEGVEGEEGEEGEEGAAPTEGEGGGSAEGGEEKASE